MYWDDGLLHTTCGSPNYVAPEILSNRGYDGATSDTWSRGVMLYVILTGYLLFDDRNLAVLYQKIFKGDAQMPKWLPAGANNLIKRILDPNPKTRITMVEIKADEWFKRDYMPAIVNEEEDVPIDDEVLSVPEPPTDPEKDPELPTHINAFALIGMSSSLDLSGFFEKEVFEIKPMLWVFPFFSWKVVKCNQQPANWECGYYVLNWMNYIVNHYQDVNDINEISWNECPLSKNEIDDIIEQWHVFCPF